MTYTRHGHHIHGTVKDTMYPPAVARCGGPKICKKCAEDVAEALSQNQVEDFETDYPEIEHLT